MGSLSEGGRGSEWMAGNVMMKNEAEVMKWGHNEVISNDLGNEVTSQRIQATLEVGEKKRKQTSWNPQKEHSPANTLI